MVDCDVQVAGETLTLMPEKTVFWERENILFCADVHLGRAALMRTGGIPVPEGMTVDDLTRLTAAIQRSGAHRLIILGDLVHGIKGLTETIDSTVTAWRASHPELGIVLVRGNHDQWAGDPPASWEMSTVPPGYRLPPFTLVHDPTNYKHEGYGLGGHYHPGMPITIAGSSFKLPCFWFGARVGVLPAFGSFTGLALVRPQPEDQVFVVADEQVLQLAP